MKSYTKQIFLSAFFFLAIGCETSGDLFSGLSDLYIPNFSNGWTVDKGDPTGSIFFIRATDIDSTKATGLIEGDEQTGTDNFKVKGSFEKLKVKLTYLTDAENGGFFNGPHAGFSYAGLYDTLSNPFRIRLVNINNASDSLVLKQG